MGTSSKKNAGTSPNDINNLFGGLDLSTPTTNMNLFENVQSSQSSQGGAQSNNTNTNTNDIFSSLGAVIHLIFIINLDLFKSRW